MILYIFICCKPKMKTCFKRITTMMHNLDCENYVIVEGGSLKDTYDNKSHILRLDCNDYYEGLPEKVVKTFCYIANNSQFEKYTYFCKLDDDMIIRKDFDINILTDYSGVCSIIDFNTKAMDRGYHIGRCSKNSYFNTNKYEGEIVRYCLGGLGYIISRKALNHIITDTNYKNEIYEDLYIGKILFKHNIFPKNMLNIFIKHLYSIDHYAIESLVFFYAAYLLDKFIETEE